jgi:hypothetical protein
LNDFGCLTLLQVQHFVGSMLRAAQVGMYGSSRPAPSPSEITAFYDLLQHYLKSLASTLPPGDVVHSSHHSLQVCRALQRNRSCTYCQPVRQLEAGSLTALPCSAARVKQQLSACHLWASLGLENPGHQLKRGPVTCRRWAAWWCSGERTRRC